MRSACCAKSCTATSTQSPQKNPWKDRPLISLVQLLRFCRIFLLLLVTSSTSWSGRGTFLKGTYWESNTQTPKSPPWFSSWSINTFYPQPSLPLNLWCRLTSHWMRIACVFKCFILLSHCIVLFIYLLHVLQCSSACLTDCSYLLCIWISVFYFFML